MRIYDEDGMLPTRDDKTQKEILRILERAFERNQTGNFIKFKRREFVKSKESKR
jgi:hypothetical protein